MTELQAGALHQYLQRVSLRERGLLVDEKEQKRVAILNEFWNFLKEPANREGLRQLIEQARRNVE